MEFPSQVVSKTYSIVFWRSSSSISCQIRTIFEPVQGPCTMNVRNETLHEMACVVKRGTPPEWRWKLCESQHRKSILVPGIKLIGWMGWGPEFWKLVCFPFGLIVIIGSPSVEKVSIRTRLLPFSLGDSTEWPCRRLFFVTKESLLLFWLMLLLLLPKK